MADITPLIKAIKRIMNRIWINDESFEVQGNSIEVRNGKVIVGNTIIERDYRNHKEIHVRFEGDLASLDCTTATINGSVKGSVDGTTITITGNVGGNVDGSTINCGNVGGNVDGTTINCGNVQGDIDAMTVKVNSKNK